LSDALTAKYNFVTELFKEETISRHIFQLTPSYLEQFMLDLRAFQPRAGATFSSSSSTSPLSASFS
jgi:hypothetical protein